MAVYLAHVTYFFSYRRPTTFSFGVALLPASRVYKLHEKGTKPSWAALSICSNSFSSGFSFFFVVVRFGSFVFLTLLEPLISSSSSLRRFRKLHGDDDGSSCVCMCMCMGLCLRVCVCMYGWYQLGKAFSDGCNSERRLCLLPAPLRSVGYDDIAVWDKEKERKAWKLKTRLSKKISSETTRTAGKKGEIDILLYVCPCNNQRHVQHIFRMNRGRRTLANDVGVETQERRRI